MGLNKDKLTILSVGGSLGSRTLNNAWKSHLEQIIDKDYQLIWQTGKLDYKDIINETKDIATENIQILEFIKDMELAYSAADIIVSRAGAIAISELAVAQKPVLLVPFPFAAEDHQTKNAMNLVEKNAARMVKDSEMQEKFWNTLSEICENESVRKEMSDNLKYFAKPNAAKEIVDEIFKVIK
jgi:UDP-N-acetylglucosamine--N-acetylmuramyl-(pentapeptide) pyrophosphoryl-undecaprenol N-acetylglucosamine transferase